MEKRGGEMASSVLNAAAQASGTVAVAVLDALVDGISDGIVRGMHVAAWASAAMLVASAALAMRWVGRRPALA